MSQIIVVLGVHEMTGSRLCTALAATRWAVPIAAVTARTGAGGGVEQRVFDPARPESVEKAVAGAAAIVNCAVPGGARFVSLTRDLSEAAKRSRSKPALVHLSSMTVYGSARGVVDESAPLLTDLGEYAAAHVAAERIVAEYPHTTVFRPGCEYGPGSPQWSTRIAQLLMSKRLGDLGPEGDGFCNLVHVDDVVRAIVLALEHNRASGPLAAARVFNLSSSGDLTWNDYLRRFAVELGATPVPRISRRWLDLESRVLAVPLKLGQMLTRPLRVDGRMPAPLTPSLRSLMRQRIRLDAARVQSELGLRWQELDSGLRETARWYLNDRRGVRALHV